MLKVLEKRKELLKLIDTVAHEKGYFDVQDLVVYTSLPRSTLQDWINRFVDEGCVEVLEEGSGRKRARYARRRMRTLPASACRKIFTTADREHVEIFHQCRSEGCIAFCEYMYSKGNPFVWRNGLTLRQRVRIGEPDMRLDDRVSMGLEKVTVSNGLVHQHIRTYGGPSYSLTEMMEQAEGVLNVEYHREGDYLEGVIVTEALTHVAIGIDDTDSESGGGATFALTLSLLDQLSSIEGVYRISHNVAFLCPDVPYKTAGNSVSYIELAVKPELVNSIIQTALEYLKSQSKSGETGMAVKIGLKMCPELHVFARKARSSIVTMEEAMYAAKKSRIKTYEVTGPRGLIGAIASLGMLECPTDRLLDVTKKF